MHVASASTVSDRSIRSPQPVANGPMSFSSFKASAAPETGRGTAWISQPNRLKNRPWLSIVHSPSWRAR